MSTRGYLVFKWNGKFYILYNHHDSYPSCMGAAIIYQIMEWMKRFEGNTKSVQEFLSSLLQELNFVEGPYSYDPTREMHPFGQNHLFEDLEAKLRVTHIPILVEAIQTEDPCCNIMIEYVWIINLEMRTLEMKSWDNEVCWPWSSLYYQMRSVSVSEWLEIWENETPVNFGIIKLQASVRRFLFTRRALCPPDGVLYLLAKMRFERSQV
jgi:hypothetical protein